MPTRILVRLMVAVVMTGATVAGPLEDAPAAYKAATAAIQQAEREAVPLAGDQG